MLGDLAVTEQVMGPVLARRSDAERLVAPAEHLTLLVLFDSTLDYRSDRSANCAAGDVLFLDYRRSFDYRTPGHHGATVNLPRAVVEDRLGPITGHGRLPRSAETRLFADFMRTLVTQLPGLAALSAGPVAAILRRIILVTLGQADAPVDLPALGSARGRALAYVEAQPPGTLDVARMTAAIGTSRAALYRLFEADGGVRAYDRRRRLRLLHLALLEAPRDRSLGELGAQLGFFDLSTLGRQFRAQFGHSMSEVREHLPPAAAPFSPEAPLDRFRSAIERLSHSGT